MPLGNLPPEAVGLGKPIKSFTVNRIIAAGTGIPLILIGTLCLAYGVSTFLRPFDMGEWRRQIGLSVAGIALTGAYFLVRGILAGQRPKLFGADHTKLGERNAWWGSWLLVIAAALSLGLLDKGFFFILGGAFTIGVAIWGFTRTGNPSASGAILYSGGLSYSSRGVTRLIRWDEIEATFIHSPQRPTYMLLRLKDGTTCRVSNMMLKDYGQLLAEISSRFAESILPSMKHRFDTGKPLEFGSVTLSREGIAQNKQFIQWGEVKEVRVSQKGDLEVVLREGKVKKLRGTEAVDIPNFEALLKIVEYALHKYQ